jgi:CHASE3 domain sensor protein
VRFLHNQTIKNKIIFGFAIFMVLFAVIFAIKETIQYRNNFNEQVKIYKQEAYKNKKEEL